MKVAISGASGYLGSRIARFLYGAGHRVCALSRQPLSNQSCGIEFDLSGRIPKPGDFASRSIDVLVHCAYSFSSMTTEASRRVNVKGSAKLFKSARAGGVARIVNISTMSAFPGSRSVYGRSKLAIEAAAGEVDGISLRPGLIYGAAAGGMIGALERVVHKSVFVPVISEGTGKLHLIHDEDLVGIVGAAVLADRMPERGLITCAHPDAMTLREILQVIAMRARLDRVFLPVPWRLAWAGLRSLEALSLPLKFRSDSILGLVFADPAPEIRLDILEQLLGRHLCRFASNEHLSA